MSCFPLFTEKPTDSQGIISPGMDGIVYVDLGEFQSYGVDI